MWSESEFRSLAAAEPTPDHHADPAGDPPHILCVADDAYAMPLAVTLASAARQLRSGLPLIVHLFDAGIREANWVGLKETLADLPIHVDRLPFDSARLQRLPVSHHISHAAYARLLAADLLPRDLRRVVYLDSDLLVRHDLTPLWEAPFDGAWCLAVPDIACPFVDARHADSNYRRAAPYLATPAPIRNWQALGLNPGDHYFNSGVLVIDLEAWRREDLSRRFLDCLAVNERWVWCWDQYALNVVLAGRWRRLPLRWNVGSHAFDYAEPTAAPWPADEFAAALEDPAILHFTSEFKPWRWKAIHPHRADFFEFLRQTAWHDWQPSPPQHPWRMWTDRWGIRLQKAATIACRSVTASWSRGPVAPSQVQPVQLRAIAAASPSRPALAAEHHASDDPLEASVGNVGP